MTEILEPICTLMCQVKVHKLKKIHKFMRNLYIHFVFTIYSLYGLDKYMYIDGKIKANRNRWVSVVIFNAAQRQLKSHLLVFIVLVKELGF